ncbi:MAG TPA: cadherin-like domain-containing protein, partial [Planctomycetota bacterium]|nr:cadherin-like domain-containing protein [Planctomycetota bacterium]
MRAGTISITATGGTLVAGPALAMTVNASSAAKFLVTGMGTTTPIAGQATTLDVVVQDAGGNITTVSTPVNLTLSASPTAGSLRVGYTGAQVGVGSSSTTIAGLILDHAENGVVVTVVDSANVLALANGPTMTVSNDQPVLAIGTGSLRYAGGSGAVPFGLPGIAVSDVNSAGFTPFFTGASATVTFTGGLIAGEDLLQVRSAGLVSVTGTTIRYNTHVIATVTGGLAGAPLAVNFTTAFADQAAVAAVLENLCYHNVGGVSPTIGSRTLQLDFNDGSSAVPGGAQAATPVTRTIVVQVGNALPVLVTNTGLSVTRGSTIAITSAMLQVSDEESGPSALIYHVVNFPQKGDLWLGSGVGAQKLAPGGLTSFTQADIDGSQLFYEHGGGTAPGDSIDVIIDDGTNQLPLTTITIVVPGANLNPTLFLPITTLTWTEGAAPSAIDPGLNSTLVLDSDTFDFGGGTLTIEVVDSDDQADAHAGDRLSVGGAGLGSPLMAIMDFTFTGIGKALRLTLLAGMDGLGASLASAQAVARLIGSLQFSSVSD